ncbi:hypothetical protein C8R47DRAFT_1324617 [Mycena vitilis]|nr:hypothetical protein C8R47DRAFT_1324617 [Mycena vitilis]
MLSALAADRTHVAHIYAQVLALEHSLLALRTEKALALQRLDRCLQVPGPDVAKRNRIGDLTHFLPVYPLCPPSTGDSSLTLLTHICRAWREIALATPGLWRAITCNSDLSLRALEISQSSPPPSPLPTQGLSDAAAPSAGLGIQE